MTSARPLLKLAALGPLTWATTIAMLCPTCGHNVACGSRHCHACLAIFAALRDLLDPEPEETR